VVERVVEHRRLTKRTPAPTALIVIDEFEN
jgi:hypothetical protein